jgi:hypothetical protein
MSNDTAPYTRQVISREWTEDGDLFMTWEVKTKGFEGVRAFHKDADRFIDTWVGCGNGWMKGTYGVLVDGAEIAIEARNDEWASRQQDIEDHGRGSAGWFW